VKQNAVLNCVASTAVFCSLLLLQMFVLNLNLCSSAEAGIVLNLLTFEQK